jgi:hypothetical protein
MRLPRTALARRDREDYLPGLQWLWTRNKAIARARYRLVCLCERGVHTVGRLWGDVCRPTLKWEDLKWTLFHPCHCWAPSQRACSVDTVVVVACGCSQWIGGVDTASASLSFLIGMCWSSESRETAPVFLLSPPPLSARTNAAALAYLLASRGKISWSSAKY